MYEYGILKGTEYGFVINWTFDNYKENPIEYDYYYDLVECLNELGKNGWRLSIVKDVNEYILYRKSSLKGD